MNIIELFPEQGINKNMDIVIQRISRNGLTKQEWRFSCQNSKLYYTSWFEYNRSNREEKWADEDPVEPLSYEAWLEKNGRDWDEWAEYDAGYQDYRDSINPVCQKTKFGKTRLHGTCAGDISSMPKCPESVAKEALKEFKKKLKVVYE
jgi:hypothetical protein